MTNVNNYRISATIVLLLLVVPTTMQISYAQFGEQPQEQLEEEPERQKTSLELNREALEILENNPNLTPAQENQIEFLKKAIEAQEALRRENPQIFGSSPSVSSSSDITTETNATTTMTLEEAEAAIANATRVIEEAEYKIEKAEEVIAAGEVIGTHTPRILGHAIGLDTHLKNNNTQGAFEKLDLIFAELKSLSGNLTSMKEAAE